MKEKDYAEFHHYDFLRKSKFQVEIVHNGGLVVDGWLSPLGEIVLNESHHHVEKALDIIKAHGHENMFKTVNMNKGYDAGEFIIYHYGYVAIESKYIIYRKSTHAQRSILECIQWATFLVPKKAYSSFVTDMSEQIKFNERSFNEDEYYSRWENQFHSPGGYPRQGYLEWKRRTGRG